jgi:hypothetical protein
MKPNVVVGCVRIGVRLGMVVAPELAPGIKDCTGGRGEVFFFDKIDKINGIYRIGRS